MTRRQETLLLTSSFSLSREVYNMGNPNSYKIKCTNYHIPTHKFVLPLDFF